MSKLVKYFTIAERGNPNHTLGKHGLPYEVIGPDSVDGGPSMLAACPTRKDAERILTALKTIEGVSQ